MDYRRLGRSGLKISPLCLGTMMFGAQTDEATARASSIEPAIRASTSSTRPTSMPTAAPRRSSGGPSRTQRDDWVLATKLGNPIGSRPGDAGLSRHWMMRAVEASLRRLGVDCIDIYYFHKEDHETPLSESVHAVADLIRQGKVRHFGVSNFRSWRVAEICRLCDEIGIDRPVVSQPYYNAMNRMPETEHLPACGFYGLGVVPYSPLARGVLTGKYLPDAEPLEGSRAARRDQRMMQSEWRTGIAALCAGDQETCASARHRRGRVRGRLAVEQPARHLGHRRPAHRGAMGGLSEGARLSLHRRGRGLDRSPRRARSSLDARL